MAIDYPDRIVAVRNSSPLVIGVGKEGNLLALDTSAIIDQTKDVIYMNDGEVAVLRKDNVKIFNIFSLREMSRRDTKFSAKGGSAAG